MLSADAGWMQIGRGGGLLTASWKGCVSKQCSSNLRCYQENILSSWKNNENPNSDSWYPGRD
jgi:hypothetical protein